MNASLLIVEAAVVVLTAPVAGVALASRSTSRGVWAALRLVATAVAVLMPLFALATVVAGRGPTIDTLGAALVSQVTLGAAALALSALGALCGSTMRDPLDAAAASTLLALFAAVGLFAAGPLAADLPTPVVNAALAANPIVATAWAAGIDLLRTDLLYRLTPVAHQRFDYPTWYGASASYLAFALLSAAGGACLRKPNA